MPDDDAQPLAPNLHERPVDKCLLAFWPFKCPLAVQPAGSMSDPTRKFYWDMQNEQFRRSPERYNEMLRQLIALNTSLIGGTAAFLSPAWFPPDLRFSGAIMFLLSILAALLGLFPKDTAALEYSEMEIFKQRRKQRLEWLRFSSIVAVFLLFIGIGITLTGISISGQKEYILRRREDTLQLNVGELQERQQKVEAAQEKLAAAQKDLETRKDQLQAKEKELSRREADIVRREQAPPKAPPSRSPVQKSAPDSK